MRRASVSLPPRRGNVKFAFPKLFDETKGLGRLRCLAF